LNSHQTLSDIAAAKLGVSGLTLASDAFVDQTITIVIKAVTDF
jgi:hypothetical protein